jgi:hypothetical protein
MFARWVAGPGERAVLAMVEHSIGRAAGHPSIAQRTRYIVAKRGCSSPEENDFDPGKRGQAASNLEKQLRSFGDVKATNST